MSSMDLLSKSMPLLIQGASLTLQILLLSASVSLCLGLFFGILTCRRLRKAPWSAFFEAVTFILRAVPFYVQLLIFYFVLPDLIGINMDAFTASVLSLGICSSGYVAQVVRGGINSIPQEQWEAAATLGYTTFATLRYSIIPQTVRNILPALTSELDALVKSTAILSSIGLLELTRVGMNIVSRHMEPLTIYLFVALFYVLISAMINLVSKYVEKRIRYANS